MAEKKVKEIFSDYKTEAIIKNAEVKALNVNKKNNSLGVILYSPKYIEIKDIWQFEKFLKERFKFNKIDTKMQYDEGTKIKSIEKEWENIICYVSHRFPIAKNMLFKKSEVEVKEDTIIIKMHIPGAEFLKTKKADVEIEGTIERLFQKKYKIELVENVSEEDKKAIKESNKKVEKKAIERIMENAVISRQETKKENQEIVKEKPKEPIEEKETPLILGRSTKIRESLIKIEELTIDDGRVSISGDVLNVEARELRSGKTLLMFDIYDGTSTLTCKAFLGQEKAERVISRVKKAKGLQIVGNAQFDQYAGELTVMTNTIIETEGLKKVERQDLAEEKRVELHMHTKMSQWME